MWPWGHQQRHPPLDVEEQEDDEVQPMDDGEQVDGGPSVTCRGAEDASVASSLDLRMLPGDDGVKRQRRRLTLPRELLRNFVVPGPNLKSRKIIKIVAKQKLSIEKKKILKKPNENSLEFSWLRNNMIKIYVNSFAFIIKVIFMRDVSIIYQLQEIKTINVVNNKKLTARYRIIAEQSIFSFRKSEYG